jgi:DNA gyrase subunit A
MDFVPGPDFPTGGFIHGMDGIRSAYTTGRGIIQMRARAHIETDEKTDRQAIVVTEIPYQVNKARLVEQIAELVREKKVDGITDLRDESDRERHPDRHGRAPRRGAGGDPQHPLQAHPDADHLRHHPAGDRRQPAAGAEPQGDAAHFLDHRKTVVVRRTRYDLRKAEERAHILEGILKALDHLDEVIATIRASQTPAEARENLISGFALSEVQAQAILDMRLQRLTGLEREKVVDEYRELMALIERCVPSSAPTSWSGGDPRELPPCAEPTATRGAPRSCRTHDISIEDMIADEDMVITVTQTGYVKRSPLALYRAQHRGGKGRTGMLTRRATSSSTSTSPRRTATCWSSPPPGGSTGSRCTPSPRPGRRRAARRSSTCSISTRTNGWRRRWRCASSRRTTT